MKKHLFYIISFSFLLFSAGLNAQQNIALNKPARQSGTLEGASASRAVDGNTNGTWAGRSLSHTDEHDSEEWLEIDLGDLYDITQVKIYNRTDCCHERIQGLNIMTSRFGFDGMVPEAAFARNIRAFTGSRTFNGETTGRYVRLQLPGRNPLHVAEVEVYGEKFSSYHISPTVTTAIIEEPTYQDNGLDQRWSGKFVRIANNGNRINVEKGLVCAPIHDGAYSADWMARKYPSGYVTFENRWRRGQFLYLDGGSRSLKSGRVASDATEARWKIEKVAGRADTYTITNIRYPAQTIYFSNSSLKTGDIPATNRQSWWVINR